MTVIDPTILPSPRIPKAVLIQLIATLSGVETLWRSDAVPPAPGRGAGLERARIWLRLSSYTSQGVDEQRAVFNVTTGQNSVVNVGQRQFTLNVKAESFTPTIEAFDLCERVRFRLRTQTARAIFVPAKLGLRDVQAITAFESVADSRTVLCASMDIRWNYVVFADPNDPNEGDWIAQADGAGVIPATLLP